MHMNFDELLKKVYSCETKTLSVACAHDKPVLEAVKAAKEKNIANAILVGDADKIAEIAKEIGMNLSDFEIIDEKIDVINKIPNISEIEPMTHALDDFTYELREDEVEDSISIDDALANCDSYLGREVKVPKVVE